LRRCHAARLEVAHEVLDVVPVLVGEHVRPGERRVLRAEPVLELLEEAEVEIDVLVDRAVERAGLPSGLATAGRHAVVNRIVSACS
jgi:hypothetical protein